MDPLTYVIIGVVVVAIVGGIIFTVMRTNAIKKNGIEANAVVSRIKEQENTDSEGITDTTYIYYVTFTTQDGQSVEAKLSNPPSKIKVGDSLTIKYLPNKPKLVIAIK
ncbi:MAG: hypothetical protein IJQ50_06590 [Clostridia bacterium]|nr:hypothetical protein [Clostridia bacterium]